MSTRMGSGGGLLSRRYRRSTVQVRVRVTRATAWMRETTSMPSYSIPGA